MKLLENYTAEKIKSKIRDEVVLRSEIDNPYLEEYINNVIDAVVLEMENLIDKKIDVALKRERDKLISGLRARGIR